MKLLTLLELSLSHHASDLHLYPDYIPRFRIDGHLVSLTDELIDIELCLNEIMTTSQQKKLEKTREIDFSLELSNKTRFRVTVFYQHKGMAAVFRVVPSIIPTLEKLNFPLHFKEFLSLSSGLILITGPTGSGKSTTLAAMIDFLNKNYASHIVTIEDPIEFIHSSKKSFVTQRQVGRDTKNFVSGLRSALRQDPNVIMLGEMRDLETIRLALTAAETGHLVLGTLHTSSAARSIHRIIDVFPGSEKNAVRHILAESLQAVISQILIKKKDGSRMAAFETLVATPAVRHLIREDKVSQLCSVMQTGKEVGMYTREQYLMSMQ